MQNQPSSSSPLDPRAAGQSTADPATARRRLAETFRTGELIWLVNEKYDQQADAWNIDIVRQGGFGQWMRQRYRYDQQAEVLYFMGATTLSESEFNAARSSGTIFPSLIS